MIYGASGWACQDLKGARRPDHITDLLSGDTTNIGAIHARCRSGA
jgi:hypothetical protein